MTDEQIDALWHKAEGTRLGNMATYLRAREFAHLLLATHAGAAAETSDAEFEDWLRMVCLQKPSPEAFDLARDAYRHAAALTSAPAEPPKGFVLVPTEPTDAMTWAGQQARYPATNSMTVIYKAMLAAAPAETPPAAGAIDARDFQDAIRAAEISHSGMSYGDEKSGASSEYTRGWGDCLKAIRGATPHPHVANVWQRVPPMPTKEMIEAAASTPELQDAKQDIENMWRAMLAAAPGAAIDAREQPEVDALRAEGWTVAVHNDYRLNGEPYTFWLFTKGDRAAKGEGRTDAEALAKVRSALASRQEAPAAAGAALAVSEDWKINALKDAPPYCLACEVEGHQTHECHSTHGFNSPRDMEMARLSWIAGGHLAATPAPETVLAALEDAKNAMLDVAYGAPVFGQPVRNAIEKIDAALKAAQPIEREDGK